MGTCSCINSEATRPDLSLDPQRIKEISKQIYLFIAFTLIL